jgi:hypothetical protein
MNTKGYPSERTAEKGEKAQVIVVPEDWYSSTGITTPEYPLIA